MKEEIQKGLVTKWFPEKGFGFVTVGGRNVFVHVNKVLGFAGLSDETLLGDTLFISSIQMGPKGPFVGSAMTAGYFERDQRQRQLDQDRIDKSLIKAQKEAEKEAEFRRKYPEMLKVWRESLDPQMEKFFVNQETCLLPCWLSKCPHDLKLEVLDIFEPYNIRAKNFLKSRDDARVEEIHSIACRLADEIGMLAEDRDHWFESFKKRKENIHSKHIEDDIRKSLVTYKRKIQWVHAEGIRKTIICLARSKNSTNAVFSRADLSAMTVEKVVQLFPQVIACYLGGKRPDVHVRIYGNSGDTRILDSGGLVEYGEWHIVPRIAELIYDGRAEEALRQVHKEVDQVVD